MTASPVGSGSLRRWRAAVLLVGALALCLTLGWQVSGGLHSSAAANTSHAGWPTFDTLWIGGDSGGRLIGTLGNDELLGGDGNDIIKGGPGDDVLWGDYHPGGTSNQHDALYGGAGNDFLYTSNGTNVVNAGPGNDTVYAEDGSGTVDCGPGTDVVIVTHVSRPRFKLKGCERIEFK
jgi:Ca2+-binding RTX toxin-like protein